MGGEDGPHNEIATAAQDQDNEIVWVVRPYVLDGRMMPRIISIAFLVPATIGLMSCNHREKIFAYRYRVHALLQKLVGDIFIFDFGREIRWEFRREFCGIFLDPQIIGSRISGKFRSIFREKMRASNKIFRANFVLQKRHLNLT